MTPMGFEPTISAGERPQTYALDRAATGIGEICICMNKIEKVRFTEINKHFWGLEVINYFVTYIHYRMKS